ncbi:triose-phosphate isomerase [Anoxybacterium hadale]|uniref:Triose-phosphate isomerase n=1 Tax=Anoxybacterium hadale TaxID=3408580 RepID=A0ACD1A7M3_9FIRM|nr:triose-phosphate isomerase [Clostridiales bacterium]
MNQKLYFGTNLKMYKTISDTLDYLSKLADLTKDISRDNIELFVIPSYTSLVKASETIDQNLIKLGAQNMNWEDQGQFTGEISPIMLKELNLELVMIGHSERRHVFRESDIDENKKVRSALSHDLTVLLCIGETLEEKNFGVSEEVLRRQLKIGLHNIPNERIHQLWIAYEPVWAIGVNGIPATSDYAERMHRLIKECLSELFGEEAKQIPVLYGGSVNPGNAEDLIVQPSIDGLFTGRSAWQADDFNLLIRSSLLTYQNRESAADTNK